MYRARSPTHYVSGQFHKVHASGGQAVRPAHKFDDLSKGVSVYNVLSCGVVSVEVFDSQLSEHRKLRGVQLIGAGPKEHESHDTSSVSNIVSTLFSDFTGPVQLIHVITSWFLIL